MISPVFVWLDAAREMGRLAECRDRVEQARTTDDDQQQRVRLALLLLIDLERGSPSGHDAESEKLFEMLRQQTPVGIADQWPETLLAVRGVENFPDNPLISELISQLALQRTMQWKPTGIELWHNHIASLYGRILRRRQQVLASSGSSSDMTGAISASREA